MPGRVSLSGYREMRASQKGAKAGKNLARAIDQGFTVDATKNPAKWIPTPDSAVDPAAVARGKQILTKAKTGSFTGKGLPGLGFRAKWERTARRMTTLMPEARTFNFNESTASEQVRKFAALYMPKFEADRLAAQYALSDLAGKRQVYKG